MMPKLPPPSVGREWNEPLYTIEQMIEAMRAVAESCAAIAVRHGNERQDNVEVWASAGSIADAIREAAKEIGK